MSIEAALSTKLKGPPAPTGDPLDLSTQTPEPNKQRVWTITEESPMILTVSGGATPATADPRGVSCANLKAPAFQKPEAAPQPSQLPSFRSRELLAICKEAARNGWTPADYLAVARWCKCNQPQAVSFWLRLAMGVGA